MRRRWSWPILEVLRGVDEDAWVSAWLVWLVAGFVILVLPAAIVDEGDYLLVASIVYGIPAVGGPLVALGVRVWWLLADYGHMLLPRRVTEPVREDLRARSRQP